MIRCMGSDPGRRCAAARPWLKKYIDRAKTTIASMIDHSGIIFRLSPSPYSRALEASDVRLFQNLLIASPHCPPFPRATKPEP